MPALLHVEASSGSSAINSAGDVGDWPGDTGPAGVNLGSWAPVRIRPTSVQGRLRTGLRTGNAVVDRGRGPGRDHAADRPTPSATWLVNGKRDASLTLTATCDRTGRSLSLGGFVAVFDQFEEFDISTEGASIHGRRGGSGPPLLLLHGIPETHLMWHRVAPDLAERYTVVATDLRGYGDSGKPPSTADHEPYSMRAIGRDQLGVMRHLGYDQFSIVGHDRGARCAYRLALDHPDNILRLTVLDVVPVGDAYNRADKDFSLLYWQWSFLAAPEPVPERFMNAAPAGMVDFMLNTWSEVKDAFPPEVRGEYIDKFSHPDTVHAICEEFRASPTLDYQQDEADRGNRKISCPVLFLWSQRGSVAKLYDDPLAIWQEWADDVRSGPVPVGHFIPEEAPEETTRQLLNFLQ